MGHVFLQSAMYLVATIISCIKESISLFEYPYLVLQFLTFPFHESHPNTRSDFYNLCEFAANWIENIQRVINA